jgi:long-subunit fatty acid transport protein
MGGAFTGVADDATAIYWNPAGACQLTGRELTLGHTEYVADIKMANAAYTVPMGRYTVGVGVKNLYVEDWRRDIDGNVLGTFVNNLTSLGVMLSYKMDSGISIGGVINGLHEQLDTERASGVGLDVGMMYPIGGISLGVVVKNLGTGMNYGDVNAALPTDLRIGIGYGGLASGKALVSSDIDIPMEGTKSLSVGGEYNLYKTLYIRGGYTFREGGSELGPLYGLNAGLGFCIDEYKVNYGLAPFGDFATVHRISLNTRF